MKEEVCIKQPRGHVDQNNKYKVWRLRKSLYGLRQSSRNWAKTVKAGMTAVGFVQSENDACLYTMKIDNCFIHTVIHVDDFSCFHNNKDRCDTVFTNLNKHFTLKRGSLTHFLGMRVIRDQIDNTFSLDQEEYATSILQRFGMYNCKTVVCPEV